MVSASVGVMLAKGVAMRIVFAVMLLMVSAQAMAADCAPTAVVAVQNYPGAALIPPSNNLLLPAGKAVEAEGQKIVIRGRVVDSQCMPVPDATVELWQNNPFGKWTLAGPRERATPNAVFAGAGRTITNSDGEFTFITAFPAPLNKRAPFVNVKVMHRDFDDRSTALFFSDDARNESDAVYKKLKAKAREDATIQVEQDGEGELIGRVEIVLPGEVAFRTY